MAKLYENLFQVIQGYNGLDERDRYVITRHYGLDGREPISLQQIATELNVTRERIRQLEARALRHLLTTLHEPEGDEDDTIQFD